MTTSRDPIARPADADRAYRRAWWALALYPVSFVAAFVVGEGIISILTGESDGTGDPAFGQVVLAALPALTIFLVPGLLAMVAGRRARRLGRDDGWVPALVGATIGLGFVGLNVASYVVGRLLG